MRDEGLEEGGLSGKAEELQGVMRGGSGGSGGK